MTHLLEDKVKHLVQLIKEEISPDAPLPTPVGDKGIGKGLKMVLDVNKNQTKKGIKVQFILPDGMKPSEIEETTQKLKTKLNAGLTPLGLSVDTDLDVPYENVIGFLIRLESFKLLIKNILTPKETNGEENYNGSPV